MTTERFTTGAMHELLASRLLSERYLSIGDGWIADQALFCPYYAILTGPLGADWGVVLNPASSRFGLLRRRRRKNPPMRCGCPDHGDLVGTQSSVDWLKPKRLRQWWERSFSGQPTGEYPRGMHK